MNKPAFSSMEKNPAAFASRALLLVATLFVLVMMTWPVAAFEIKEVTSPKGIKALLVEDYTVPIISMSFALKGGTTQDLPGKEGTVTFLSSMFDEGAGERDNISYQRKADELGAEIRYYAGDDKFGGSIRMLKANEDASFELLNEALNQPRFDAKPMERIRSALKENLVRSKFDPEILASRALRTSMYGKHPYGREDNGTLESLDKISRDDLIAMKARIFSRQHLFIGAVGAISPEDLGRKLDEIFGSWPEKSGITPVEDITPVLGSETKVDLDTPQARVSMIYPGIKRDDPDFFAAYLMNYILGGGTFTSYLYDEVREKRGLVYSINSSISNKDHASYIGIGFGTRADQTREAIDLVKQQVKRMANEGPSEAELAAAKKYVFGAYAINNFDTSGSIASVLVTIQEEGLGNDYIDKRGGLINAVTLDDVKRVAKKLLASEPTIVVVGPPSS